MEEKYTAITLKSVDYQEDNKMLWLYTAEHGKIVATAKGVKKANAKLKFAVEPFCFGEFAINVSHGRNVLIGCVLSDSFYNLREDLEKYYCGCAILDIISALEREEESKPYLLVNLLKSLKALCYGNLQPKLIVAKFLLDYLKSEGYAVSFDFCNCCHTTDFTKLYLDLQVGGAVCSACRSQSTVVLDGALLTCLRYIASTPFERLNVLKLKDEYVTNCLGALNQYVSSLLGKVKGLDALISL